MKIRNRLYKRLIKIFLYALLFIFTFIFFVVILFPYNKIKKPIEFYIKKNTGLNASIKSINYVFPAGVVLKTIFLKNHNRNLCHINSVFVSLPFSDIFSYPVSRIISTSFTLYNVNVKSFKEGFFDIYGFNLKYLSSSIVYNASMHKLAGSADFHGDMNGTLNIADASLEPVFIIKNGYIKIKPKKNLFKRYSKILSMIFKKSKDSEFIYTFKGQVL